MTAPTSRLLTLLSLLQTRREWPGALLAERLGVSHRTVRRDIDRLREMGYNVQATMGPDGGYRLDAGADLPPLLFDDDQALALALALQTTAVAGSGLEEAALRALTTLRQLLPSRLRHRLDGLEVVPLPGRAGDAPPAPVSPDTLVEISAAIRAGRTLTFDYASGQGGLEPARCRVEPHHLVFSSGRWYLLAWDPGRDDWRTYRVDRITPRAPHGSRFIPRRVPGGDVADYVSARFKGSEQADRWPYTGTVILGLPAREVLPFAGDGSVEDLHDGRCSLRSGSWSWVALAASLNRFDTDIEVVEPPELGEAFRILADRNAATAARSR
ncbi:helix-turn-helix transcriptional regulator [Leucobacter celer]|uniref:helix-turn-helix transcriptional regulator n=1 Tax=Leucobacter celer TaxID=668625 RepID=UPI0006A7D75A|nr:WYL domain-containing protein [Leucobacter celer]